MLRSGLLITLLTGNNSPQFVYTPKLVIEPASIMPSPLAFFGMMLALQFNRVTGKTGIPIYYEERDTKGRVKMLTDVSTAAPEVADVSVRGPIQTTLYDLIATIRDCVAPSDNGQMITATARQILHTYRVTCIGDLKGYRLVSETVPVA